MPIDPFTAAAGIGAIGNFAGGLLGSDAADDAADAQLRASREANNLAYSQYLTSLGLQEPWRASGQSALNELNALFGYARQPYQSAVGLAQGNMAAGQSANNRLGAKAVLKMLKQGKRISEIASLGSLKTKSGVVKRLGKHLSADQISQLQAGPFGQQQGAPAQQIPQGPTGLAVFQASPDYQFRKEQGMQGIENSAAARGGAFSGNALRALSDFNSNLASGEFQNFISRRMQLAGLGQGATNHQQQAGQSYGYQGSNNLMNAGDARASGIAQQGNIWGNALSGAAQGFGRAYGQQQNAYDDYIRAGQQGWGY